MVSARQASIIVSATIGKDRARRDDPKMARGIVAAMSSQAAPFDLPPAVRELCWDVDASQLDLQAHRDFVVGRVLSRGTWDAVRWLRRAVDDQALRDYLVRSRGRHLSPRQLRLWEALLDLSHDQVSSWISAPERRVWDQRGR